MTDTDSARLVQSTTTSLRILEFVREREGTRLTDVAAELDIGHSTAHNHLATLVEEGWVVRENGEYRIGMKFLQFGRSARRSVPHFQVVRRHTNDLAKRTKLEVEFLVEESGRIVSLINIIPSDAVYGNIDDDWQGAGIFYNMTNTASGKAILAEMPDERVEEILDQWGFDARTQYSVSDREALYQQLETARERGYAKAHQEIHEGFENVAVAVKRPDDSIFGALSIGWPSYIFDDMNEREPVDNLLDAKRDLEAEIANTAGT
jgi:DNA-binding IclR family transcriptional regulator